jgi:hypothetical protein
VVRDALNYFEPYESLPPHHENQLTRALVVALKLSPMAHAVWLGRVDPALKLQALPMVDWRVQRCDIIPAGEAEAEGLRVISVFVSAERAEAGGRVEASDRGQVLDAIAVYGTELAVVVENKLAGEPDDWQARSLNIGGLTLTLDGMPRPLRWRDILGDFADLVSHQLVTGAEAGIIEDFLEYVEAYFDGLMPFNTLAVCRGSPYRQQRRLRVILAEASGIEARQDSRPSIPLSGATGVERAYLELGAGEVQLNLWPGDTLAQARVLYARPAAIAGMRRLRAEGWLLSPAFHFGHMAKGLVSTQTPLGVDEYMDLWTSKIGGVRMVKRAGWDAYWTWLIAHKVAVPADREEFRRHFDDTLRQDATPRPGLCLRRTWPIADAEAQDAHGSFVHEVRSALIAALDALGEKGVELGTEHRAAAE